VDDRRDETAGSPEKGEGELAPLGAKPGGAGMGTLREDHRPFGNAWVVLGVTEIFAHEYISQRKLKNFEFQVLEFPESYRGGRE